MLLIGTGLNNKGLLISESDEMPIDSSMHLNIKDHKTQLSSLSPINSLSTKKSEGSGKARHYSIIADCTLIVRFLEVFM